MMKAIDYVSKDFEKSNSSNFISYYCSLEDANLLNLETYTPSALLNINPELFISVCKIRKDPIIAIAQGVFTMDKANPYELIYNMLLHLAEYEPYSYLSDLNNERIHPLYAKTFNYYIKDFIIEVLSEDVTNGLEFISSSRIQVRRLYPMEDRNEFSNAVRRYFEAKTKFMKLNPPITVYVLDKDGNRHHTAGVSDFVPGEFMKKWLQIFKIGDHMSLEMDKNGLGLLLKVYLSEADKKGVLLADMGYGITQLFSILLQIEEMIMSSFCKRFKNHSPSNKSIDVFDDSPLPPRTVAIEEPEIHLHPKYQSLLAEMFQEAYKEYNIQFIIETHSEYLLRKVQTLVGIGSLSPEEVSIVYVEEDGEVKKGAEKVRRIPIKKDGRLSVPFGPGFYDEADNLSLELFKNMGR